MSFAILARRGALLFVVAGIAGPRAAAQQPTPGGGFPRTLGEAVERALAQHPRLAAGRARERAARAEVGEARGRRFPQLATQGSATRFQEPMIVAPLHGFDLQRPPQFDETLLQGSVTLSYTLFDGGARGGRIGAAEARAGAAAAELTDSEAGLIANVVRRYLAALTARGVLEAQESGVAALRAESARVELLLAQGRAARVQALQVAAALAQAEAERVAAATRLDVATRTLGREVAAEWWPDVAALLAPVRLADTLALPTRSVLHLRANGAAELGAARRQVDAARGGGRAARAAWFPQLDLVGGYLAFGSATQDFTAEWQLGVRLSYPLFSGGTRAGAVRRAGAEQAAAQARLAAAELAVADALDHALGDVEEARARERAGALAVRHLEELVRIERLRVTAGAGTETDYLRAEADLRRARAALVEARHREILARVELARLTGELSAEWLARTVETAP